MLIICAVALQADNTNVIYKQVYLSNNILYLSEIWFDDLPEYHLIVHSSRTDYY